MADLRTIRLLTFAGADFAVSGQEQQFHLVYP